MRIFAIANQKGGVGKSTSSLALGHGLAELGQRVLLVDFDPQGSLTWSLGFKPRSLSFTVYDLLRDREDALDPVAVIQHTTIPNLDLLPSRNDLARAESELLGRLNREGVLRSVLAKLTGYDVIIIDCQPSLGILTVNALTAATDVIIPVESDYLALLGATLIIKTIDQIRNSLNPALTLRSILVTKHDTRTVHAKEILEEIRSTFKDLVSQHVIKQSVRAKEAPVRGQSILGYDPTSDVAQAYRALTLNPCRLKTVLMSRGSADKSSSIIFRQAILSTLPFRRWGDLAASTRKDGLFQPIVADEGEDGNFILVGERTLSSSYRDQL